MFTVRITLGPNYFCNVGIQVQKQQNSVKVITRLHGWELSLTEVKKMIG